MRTFQACPHPRLLPFIDRIWGWESLGSQPVDLPTLLPGTGAELFIHYKAPFAGLTQDNQPVAPSSTQFICLRRQAMRLLPSSGIGFIAVRFKVGMLHRFTSIPASALMDRATPAEEIWGLSASHLLPVLSRDTTLGEMLSQTQRFLLHHLREESPDPLVEGAAPLIYRNFSSASIRDLAHFHELGNRQFERRFKALTGNTPGELKRLSRFQCTLRSLMLDASLNPLEVALSNGYYDQAHFINDFRRRAFSTPEKYLREARTKTHFYNTGRRPRDMLKAPWTTP